MERRSPEYIVVGQLRNNPFVSLAGICTGPSIRRRYVVYSPIAALSEVGYTLYTKPLPITTREMRL